MHKQNLFICFIVYIYSMDNQEKINRITEKLSQLRFEKPVRLSEENIDDIILKVSEINNYLIELLVLFYKK